MTAAALEALGHLGVFVQSGLVAHVPALSIDNTLPIHNAMSIHSALASSDIVAQNSLNTRGVRGWILNNLLPLLLLTVALLLLWLGGGKGDNAGVMRRVGGVFVALAVIGLAVSGTGVDIGTFIAGLFSTSA